MGFDDFWYDDFDGDGKISESDKFFSDWMYDDLAHSWRKEVEDGAEYGLDPRDYEFRENYEKALDEAKHEWRATAEFSFKLSPEDYETEDEYNAALADLKARGEDEFSVEDCIPPRSIYESGAYPPPKAAPVKVRPQSSAKPAKPPAPPPPEQVCRSQGIKPRTAISICVALVLCLLLILFCGVRKYRQTNAVRQAYIDEVKAVCLAYGFDTVQVTFSVTEDESLLLYYPDITVNGLSGLTLPDQYALVKALNDLEIGRVNKTSITMPTVHSDGRKYDIAPWNAPNLRIDGKDVYPAPTQKPSTSSTWSSKSYTSSSSSKSTTTTTKKAATTTKSTTSSTSKKATTTRSDPYDVQDYSDPEEFYYYHYDDFYDYEDAEDYFNEHG